MTFLDRHKSVSVKVQPSGPSISADQRRRKRLLNLIKIQIELLDKPHLRTKGGRKRRSWFHKVDDKDVLIPIYRGKNFAEASSRGRHNAFPVARDKKSMLSQFNKAAMSGEFDAIIEDLDAGRARRKKKRGRGRPRKS